MHQASAFARRPVDYIVPVTQKSSTLLNRQFRILSFQSLLGTVWAGWLWAFVIGLVFLILGRRFRYDCRKRWAEWLAVAFAIVLFESVYPAFTGESWAEQWWIAARLAAAAALIAIAGWHFRAKLSPGWVAVLVSVIAVLVTLGPIRLAEATSTDVSSSAPHPVYLPSAARNPGAGRGWPLFDARAWGGYTIRALALMTLAMLAARSLLTRAERWLWTEWAALATASIIAGCWVYDELSPAPLSIERSVSCSLGHGSRDRDHRGRFDLRLGRDRTAIPPLTIVRRRG